MLCCCVLRGVCCVFVVFLWYVVLRLFVDWVMRVGLCVLFVVCWLVACCVLCVVCCFLCVISRRVGR